MNKELAINIIKDLPDDIDMMGIIEALYIRLEIEKGINDVENGRVISHEELKKEIETWK